MAPKNRGHWSKVQSRLVFLRRGRAFKRAEGAGNQSPKRATSPLRTAIAALFISNRSIAARRRPNKVLEGLSAIAAVLDILFPFLDCGGTPPPHLRSIYVYQMPATTRLFAWQQSSVCIAKELEKFGIPDNKRAAETAAALIIFQRHGRSIPPPASAADRARRNRGSRRPDDR